MALGLVGLADNTRDRVFAVLLLAPGDRWARHRPAIEGFKIVNRRDFMRFTGLATGSVLVPWLSGCALDPVTGKPGFSLLSEAQEINLDKQQSPHQFSADYGANSDSQLNAYVRSVGRALAKTSHRPAMPYNYRVVDANHVNAYTFPAGSMAITRGIIVEMESEAELAALLGHETGHVNARHSAERATKGLLAQAAVGVVTGALGDSQIQQAATQVGLVSATALLAKYSRDNEREADALGMTYAVQAGANPQGMVDLMDLLVSLNASKPDAMQVMFSSHPISDERLTNVQAQLNRNYATQRSRDMGRERYMDYTAGLRRQKALIKNLAEADLCIAAGDFDNSRLQINKARALDDEDYALWIISAKHRIATNQYRAAIADLQQAQALKPDEALPLYMNGVSHLQVAQPEAALSAFKDYQKTLPGNPSLDFFVGYSYEQMDRRESAATAYKTYLSQVASGEQAQYAYRKLQEWGYLS